MTEKRFTLTNPKNAFQEMKCGIDDKTFDKTLTFNEVVDILNNFQDLSIDDLKQIEQLKKENEQLKQNYSNLFNLHINFMIEDSKMHGGNLTRECAEELLKEELLDGGD